MFSAILTYVLSILVNGFSKVGTKDSLLLSSNETRASYLGGPRLESYSVGQYPG